MAKKKSKKKKAKESNFTAEYNNLITIFMGIFLLYSLNSESMGLLGTLMQSVFKGLFGKLSIIVPFIGRVKKFAFSHAIKSFIVRIMFFQCLNIVFLLTLQ